MNDEQVVSVMERFTGAWPWMELTDQQLDAWLDTLGDVEPGDGSTVAMKAIRTLDRPPSISWFLGEVRNEVERRNLGARRRDELPAAPDPDSKARAMAVIAQLAATEHPHDHHKGLASCQTCITALELHIAEGCEHSAHHRRDLALARARIAITEGINP